MASQPSKAFITSAPGKVIVFGEHAVVHGKAAIAAAIALRSYLLVTPRGTADNLITLDFPDIGLTHSWHIDSLPWDDFSNSSAPLDRPVTSLDSKLVSLLQPHQDSVSPELTGPKRQMHQAATMSFLYILLSIFRSRPTRGYAFTMRSTIPIAAGLGSSASISVCIAAAVLTLTSNLPAPSKTDDRKIIEANLDLINIWAFVGELCIHGTPSGVDNTVATRGKAVVFRRSQSGGPPSVLPLLDFPVLPLLLVDTKQSRSTAVEVAKVRKLLETHPSVTESILQAIDQVTDTAHRVIIECSDGGVGVSGQKPESGIVDRLGELVRVNQGLLVALGVSHPRLERIRELIDHSGIGYTKLTGAGGGGCAISLLTDTSEARLSPLEDQLRNEGFAKYETLLGGKGVGIASVDVESVPIDQDVFKNASTSEGLESLIGVSANPGSWIFWD